MILKVASPQMSLSHPAGALHTPLSLLTLGISLTQDMSLFYGYLMHFSAQVVDTGEGLLLLVMCDYSQDVLGLIVSVEQPAHHQNQECAVSAMQICKFIWQLFHDTVRPDDTGDVPGHHIQISAFASSIRCITRVCKATKLCKG